MWKYLFMGLLCRRQDLGIQNWKPVPTLHFKTHKSTHVVERWAFWYMQTQVQKREGHLTYTRKGMGKFLHRRILRRNVIRFVWRRLRLRHRLESELARPRVIITILSSKYVSEGELSNIWDYNFLRKDNTPKTGALTITRIEHYRFSLTEFFKKLWEHIIYKFIKYWLIGGLM